MGNFEKDIDDFLKDEYFVQWVLHPDENSTHYWKNWVATHPEHADLMAMAKQVILSVQYKHTDQLAEYEQRDLLENLLETQMRNENKPEIGQPHFLGQYWVSRVAATFLLMGAFAYAVWFFVMQSKQKSGAENVAEAVMMIEKISPKGQKLTVHLPDGSMVKLNAGSKMVYPQAFADNERSVSLEGEAFFEVAENHNKPFVINTDGLKTKVLGTSFNVRSYQDEAKIKVAVVTGKVEISSPNGNSSVLLPTEMGVFEREKASITKDYYEFREEIAWKDGILYFEKADLKTVVKKLELWYGVNFEVEEGFRFKGLYSGEFRNNESLEIVLDGISFTSGFNYKFNNNTVMITKNNKPYDKH